MHERHVGSSRRRLALSTLEPTSFGTGFTSGIVSAILGIAAFGVVLSLRFPAYLGFDELRSLHAQPYLRAVIHVALVAAFLLGSLSAMLRVNKALALTGIGFTLAAALLGATQPSVDRGDATTPALGVDFAVLNLMLYSAVFVPLERLFALRPEQPVFRRQWPVDLTYFFVNSLLVEILTILTLRPALVLFDWIRVDAVTGTVGALPLVLQVPALLLVADLTQYWVHRAFHVSRLLWPFHAIHHSIEQMDWLAGSRLHLLDVIVTRGLVYVPVFVFGFTEQALIVYVLIVALQATFIHANVRWEFRPLRAFIATPAFHHWHHAAEREAMDKNFAVHTPVWDRLFGTYYLPDRWPSAYGLLDRRDVPARWTTQFLYPLRRRPRRRPDTLST